MGMTVEEIKEEIRSDLTSKKMTGDGYSESFRDAIANLLIIAEKYQKIEQIIRNYDVAWELHHMKSTIDKIREIIKDDK